MPTYRSIEVHVTDVNDIPLKEWGTRTFHRAHLATCYIQSESDKAFRISLKPAVLPFPGFAKAAFKKEPVIKMEPMDDDDDYVPLPQFDGAGDEDDAMAKVRAVALQIDRRVHGLPNIRQDGIDEEVYLGPDAGKWFAFLYINDYPQKARYAVTKRGNIARVLAKTGASITQKGIFYEEDEMPGDGDPPKLYLVIEGKRKKVVERAADDLIDTLEMATQEAGCTYMAGPRAAHRYAGAKRIALKPGEVESDEESALEEQLQEGTVDEFGRDITARSRQSCSPGTPPNNVSVSAHQRHRAPAPPRHHLLHGMELSHNLRMSQVPHYNNHVAAGLSDCPAGGYGGIQHDQYPLSSPATRTNFYDRPRTPPPPAPWHLLATLRLDGRRGFEKRCIVYLDEGHPNFKPNDGLVFIKNRNVQQPDGSLHECGWYFKDVGIETVFDKLFLSGNAGDSGEAPADDEDDLLAGFSGLGANNLQDAEEKTQAGQIEVTLERVKVGVIKNDVDFEPPEGQDLDADIEAPDVDKIAHTTARDTGKERPPRINLIYFEPFKSEEKPYANFKFYYRSEENLRKFDFPGFPPRAPTAPARRNRQAALTRAALEPLSIIKRPRGSVLAFRKVNNEDVDGDADDEGSDSGLTESSVEDGDGNGVNENRDDQGLGEGLGSIQLGKRVGEESGDESAKKAKTVL